MWHTLRSLDLGPHILLRAAAAIFGGMRGGNVVQGPPHSLALTLGVVVGPRPTRDVCAPSVPAQSQSLERTLPEEGARGGIYMWCMLACGVVKRMKTFCHSKAKGTHK